VHCALSVKYMVCVCACARALSLNMVCVCVCACAGTIKEGEIEHSLYKAQKSGQGTTHEHSKHKSWSFHEYES
jgi:hypothetical protein